MYDAHLEGKKHIKAAAQLSSSGQGAVTAGGGIKENRAQKDRNMAMNEALIMAYGLELGAIREETKMNVERKQALTDKERVRY